MIGVVLVFVILVFGGPFEKRSIGAGRGDRWRVRIGRPTRREVIRES
jgi:hypothetical protein